MSLHLSTSSSIQDIPTEIVHTILDFLDLPSSTAMARTSWKMHKLSYAFFLPRYREISGFFDDLTSTLPDKKYSAHKGLLIEIEKALPIQVPGPKSLSLHLSSIKEAITFTLSTLKPDAFNQFDQLITPIFLHGVIDEAKEYAQNLLNEDQLHKTVYSVEVEYKIQKAIACALAATYRFDEAIELADQLERVICTWSVFGEDSQRNLAFKEISKTLAYVGDVPRAIEINNKMTSHKVLNLSEILKDLLREDDVDGAIEVACAMSWNERSVQILSEYSQKYAKTKNAQLLANAIKDQKNKKECS